MTYLGQRKINDFGLNVVERQIKASYPFETCLVFYCTQTHIVSLYSKKEYLNMFVKLMSLYILRTGA